MQKLGTRPELLALLEKAKNHVMTPEERIAQKRSWVRGEMMLAHADMTADECNALIDRVLPELRDPAIFREGLSDRVVPSPDEAFDNWNREAAE